MWIDDIKYEYQESSDSAVQKKSSGRGGKRAGAGRKNEGKESKTIRVPIDVDGKKLLSLRDDLTTLKEAWEKELHPTSPRDESARLIIEEINKLLG